MAPTGIPTAAAVSQLAAQTPNHQQQQPQNPQHQLAAAAAQATPYPGYNLASVDMASFNSIDWSSMYGMYV